MVAAHLRRSSRPVDLVARFGGEEFTIVLYGIGLDEAANIGDRIRRDIEQAEVLTSFGRLRLTVSVGVAGLDDCKNPQALLHNADRALYEAKHRGRNCTVVASEIGPIELV